MEKFIPILKVCPLFSEIKEAELIRLLKCLGARVKTYEKNHRVLSEGDTTEYIHILLSGSLQISQTDYQGNRTIISVLSPGDLFAEAFTCGQGEKLPFSVTAEEDSQLMLVDCSHILKTCSNSCSFHQRLIFNLMRELAEKNIALHRYTRIISQRTTSQRLMTYLRLCALEKGSSRFTVPFDRQELADYLQVDRSGLSAEIGKLKRQGLIKNRKSLFTLMDY